MLFILKKQTALLSIKDTKETPTKWKSSTILVKWERGAKIEKKIPKIDMYCKYVFSLQICSTLILQKDFLAIFEISK